MNRPDFAVEFFNKGFNCAQAVLSTYGPQLGLERETALKVAGAFGAGMGRMAETCGAVNGAIMVIGLKYSKCNDEDDNLRDKGYELVRDFVAKFKAKNGSITCKDLLQCDVSTPEGLQRAKDSNLFQSVCPNYVRDASVIVEEILELGN